MIVLNVPQTIERLRNRLAQLFNDWASWANKGEPIGDGDPGDVLTSDGAGGVSWQPGGGTVFTADSVVGNGTPGLPITLDGDDTSPDPLRYYGTDAGGARGYHEFPPPTFDAACRWSDINSDSPARAAILLNNNLRAIITVAGISGQNKATKARLTGTGKFYFEILVTTVGASGTPTIGVSQMSAGGQVGAAGTVGTNRNAGWALLANNGNKYSGSSTAYGTALVNGDVVMVALDLSGATGSIWFGKNNTWFASGNPAAGTGAAFTNLADWIYPAFTGGSNSDITANFGATPFSYTPPAGFSSWGP